MRLVVIILLVATAAVEGQLNENARVECTSSTMTVYLNRNLLDMVSEANLVHFTDESCSGTMDTSGDFIVLETQYTECGTIFAQNDTYISYSNLVTFYAPMSSGGVVITREEILRIRVRCELERQSQVENFFVPRKHKIEPVEIGFGNFSLSLDRYEDDTFTNFVADKSLEINLASQLYFGVNLDTVSGLTLLIESCWSVPYPNPNQRTYTLFEDKLQRCDKDRTVLFYPSGNPMAKRFSVQAFTFIEEEPQVYVHCSVLVCNETEVNSRCSMGQCESPSRNRRSINNLFSGSNTRQHIVSNGPFVISRGSRAVDNEHLSVETSSEISLGSGSMTVAVIGGVLCITCFVVAMVFMTLYIRASRRSRDHASQGFKSIE